MQKLVVDTNVLVSALIQKSYPFLIISHLFVQPEIELCVSDDLLQEYYAVLRRKKFSKYPDFVTAASTVLADIESRALFYIPKIKLEILADPDDNKLLELADESKADYLVTGNSNHFTITRYKKTEIVSPKDYWDLHKPF